MIRLSDVLPSGTKICDGYVLKCEPGAYVFLHIGFLANSVNVKFDHPNVASRSARIFEFKHESNSGRKRWTSKAGIEFVFVLRKEDVEVVPEIGYSYPKVKIAGEEVSLNCSGGTGGDDWVDRLNKHIHTHVNLPAKFLKHVAAKAVPPSQAGEAVESRRLGPEETKKWLGLVAQSNASKFLQPGMALHTKEGYTWNGQTGPFQYRRMEYGTYVAKKEGYEGTFALTSKSIDWFKTATENKWNIPNPETWNRAGPILPSFEELENQFYQENEGKFITIAAWGDWAEGVPKGQIGVVARINGRRGNGEERRFLVPASEYDARNYGFVVDPARHPEWPVEGPISKQAILTPG